MNFTMNSSCRLGDRSQDNLHVCTTAMVGIKHVHFFTVVLSVVVCLISRSTHAVFYSPEIEPGYKVVVVV